MPLINKTKKFIFIGNARCASSSMYERLKNLFSNDEFVWDSGRPNSRSTPLPWLYHMGASEATNRYPFIDNYFKFCFVRNPWDRFFSSYKEFQKPNHARWNAPIFKYKNFEDFCLRFEECELRKDIHFVSTYSQTINNGINCMNFVGRFENLDQDFEKVIQMVAPARFSQKSVRLKVHRRKTIVTDYRKQYSEKTKQIIGDLYKEDIENFGYTF